MRSAEASAQVIDESPAVAAELRWTERILVEDWAEEATRLDTRTAALLNMVPEVGGG